jgi:6,7-dimethyl-8-ribityllumazine synthase
MLIRIAPSWRAAYFAAMSTHHPAPAGANAPPDARVAIVAARFNPAIVEELLSGCRRRLAELAVAEFAVHRVPGAFELPVAAAALARGGQFQAIICLGCVVRGDTPHFDYVAGEAARGIQQAAVETGVPIIFGLLTTNTQQQALDRLDPAGTHGHAGERAAAAAVEMILTMRGIGQGNGRVGS